MRGLHQFRCGRYGRRCWGSPPRAQRVSWPRCRLSLRPFLSIRPSRGRRASGRMSVAGTGRPAIGMQNAPGGLLTSGNGVVQGRHGEAGLHPRVDVVTDDPPAEDVLDRIEIQLPFPGGVFGDVGEPQAVRAICGEVTADHVVVYRRTGLLGPAASFPEHAPPAVVPADPPRGPVAMTDLASRASSARKR